MDGARMHLAVNSLLECSICFQVFRDPRVLPCGHTFCFPCIQKTENQLCSLCKRKWTPPVNDVQSLPKNFTVENFITSLPSLSYCAVVGNNSHGAVKYFCTDCWDPLCEECGEAHNKHSRITKNHIVKKLNKVDQSDIELHGRKKAMLCAKHNTKMIEYHCVDCEVFICSSCYILDHNKHVCSSVEDVDTKSLSNLENLMKEVAEEINVYEAQVETFNLKKEVLEFNRSKLVATIKTLIRDVKRTMQIEYEKIVTKVDECYRNVVNLINEETNIEKNNLQQVIDRTQTKLQSFQQALSSLKKHVSPLSTAVERASYLKDNSITHLTSTFRINSINYPSKQLSDFSQWKADMDNWLQSFLQMLFNVKNLPDINIDDVIVTSRHGFVN